MKRLGVHFKSYVLRGLLTLIPLALVGWVVKMTYVAIDRAVRSLGPELFDRIPGLGLLALITVLYFVGLLASNLLGKSVMMLLDRLTERIPIVGTTWKVGKQLAKHLSPEERRAFERPVLVPYLGDDQWTVGFVSGEVQDNISGQKLLKCFIPIPPNPATGWVVFVEERKVRDPGWTIEEGMQAVLSLGIATPDSFPIDHTGEISKIKKS
ncbi:DUF502 domain-containing protein [bacterium]|nr:DUF502 domain-containing protein [bacterium]